MRKLEKKR